MHPLVARIHPSFRTAFFAWLIARATIWFGTNVRLGRVFPDLGIVVGTPLYGAVCDGAEFAGDLWGPALLFVLAELAMLAGVVAVYRFARRDGVPQTAERAAWLWIVSPAMVYAAPGSDIAMAYGLVALSMAAIMRPAWSAVLLAAAVAMRPEAIVVWPVMAWAWWAYRDGDAALRLSLAMIPAASFAATVLGALLIGEPQALLGDAAPWRSGFALGEVVGNPTELTIALSLVGAVVIALRMSKETPKSWLLVTLPVIALVAAHDPLFAGLVVIPFAVPLFVQGARLANDVSFERVLIGASLVTLSLLTLL